MSKNIDADVLKAEIEKRKNICKGIFERDSDTYYQGKAVAYQETLSFIDTLQQEQPSEDLEEATARYGSGYCDTGLRRTAEFGFRSGAEWQRQRTPMPEDTVIFQKGIEEGKRLMMEDAVEGVVIVRDDMDNRYKDIAGFFVPDDLKIGDKVKIVIVKED